MHCSVSTFRFEQLCWMRKFQRHARRPGKNQFGFESCSKRQFAHTSPFGQKESLGMLVATQQGGAASAFQEIPLLRWSARGTTMIPRRTTGPAWSQQQPQHTVLVLRRIQRFLHHGSAARTGHQKTLSAFKAGPYSPRALSFLDDVSCSVQLMQRHIAQRMADFIFPSLHLSRAAPFSGRYFEWYNISHHENHTARARMRSPKPRKDFQSRQKM